MNATCSNYMPVQQKNVFEQEWLMLSRAAPVLVEPVASNMERSGGFFFLKS